MNDIEMEKKIKELEDRIAGLPDWKKKYEDQTKAIQAFAELLGPIRLQPNPGMPVVDTLQFHLGEQQVVVNLTHEEKPVSMTTSTVVGKILFIALTELKEGFTSEELMAHLAEHGWPIGPNTISPTVGGMVKNGHLIRLSETKPPKFRTPYKVVFNVTEVK